MGQFDKGRKKGMEIKENESYRFQVRNAVRSGKYCALHGI
jgi:hypothetical protein